MRARRVLCGVGAVMALGLGAGCAHEGARYAHNQGEKIGAVFTDKVRLADKLALLDQEQIDLGHLALARSSNTEVRHFAEALVRYHSKHLEDLRALARSESFELALVNLASKDSATGGSGIELSDQADNKQVEKAARKFIKHRDELASYTGVDFDRDFLDWVRKDQHKGQKLVESALNDFRSDTSLSLLLNRTAPVLRSYQRQAESLRGFLGE